MLIYPLPLKRICFFIREEFKKTNLKRTYLAPWARGYERKENEKIIYV